MFLSARRTGETKTAFFRALRRLLGQGLEGEEVVGVEDVNVILTGTKEDWSFGNGNSYLTMPKE